MICAAMTIGYVALMGVSAFALYPVSMAIVRTVKRMSLSAPSPAVTA